MQIRSMLVTILVVAPWFVLTGNRAHAEAFRSLISDESYWHHAQYLWDQNGPNGLAALFWLKDPDPARGYTGQWCQPVDDCSSFECPVTVSGRFPPYEPGRLSGRANFRDPKPADPCHETPATFSFLIKGQGVETWIYRAEDIAKAFNGASGWCSNTAARDAFGTPIFMFRRMVTELEKYPRIARGALDFVWTGTEGLGPANHFTMSGIVDVYHDPSTLAPLAHPAVAKFRFTTTWSTSLLAQLGGFWELLAQAGLVCPKTRPNFSATGALNAATFSDQARMTIELIE